MVSYESHTRRYNAKADRGVIVRVGAGLGSVDCYEKVILFFYWVWVYICADVCVAYSYFEFIENLLLIIFRGLWMD